MSSRWRLGKDFAGGVEANVAAQKQICQGLLPA